MSSFSNMLTYLRRRSNLSQQALADKTGLTRSAIGMYETGKREPDFETLEVLADFFNVNMDTLLGKVSEKNKKAPDTLIDVEDLSENRRWLVNYVISLSEEEAKVLRGFVEFSNSRSGK